MEQSWRHLPAAARPIAAAATAAVTAARARDAEAFEEAVAALAALDSAQSGLILGTAVRLQLEKGHPDGIDGDAVREALEHCVRSAMTWQPEVDPHVILLLIAGALGVIEEDGAPPPKPDVVARHSALLLADLPLYEGARLFTNALTEIERVQLND